MATKKISALPASAALTGVEIVPVVQASTTMRTTAQAIADLASAPSSSETLLEALGNSMVTYLIPDDSNLWSGINDGYNANEGASNTYQGGALTSIAEANSRLRAATSSAINTSAGSRFNDNSAAVVRDSAVAGIGGFELLQEWSFDTARTDQRAFVGLQSGTAAFTVTADPSALLNAVGVGKDQTDSNIQIMHNDGAGSCIKVDLGVPFTSLLQKLLQLRLSVPDGGGNITYDLHNVSDNLHYTGTISGNLPAIDTRLYARFWVNTGGATATSCVIHQHRLYLRRRYA